MCPDIQKGVYYGGKSYGENFYINPILFLLVCPPGPLNSTVNRRKNYLEQKPHVFADGLIFA